MSSVTGLSMGWLCVHYQPDTTSRLCASFDGSFLESYLHSLHHLLRFGIGPINADPVCWYGFVRRRRIRIHSNRPFSCAGFQPVRTSEHMASLGVFALLNAVAVLRYLQSKLSSSEIRYVFTFGVLIAAAAVFCVVVLLTYAGIIAPWSGRFGSNMFMVSEKVFQIVLFLI